jgi:1,2-diacylglycerol-3-alpha-glucose alpha-1,2-glucosyltransferase
LSGFVVGTVGLAIQRKGIDTFVALASRFPANRFIWFGKIYSSLLAAPPPKHLPPNVTFTGYVPDILGAFNALDAFIFPSYEENQGIVILEAAAVGLPIIVRDIPVYEGWLTHEENCLKAKNNDEFAHCIQRLIADGALRQKLSDGARALAMREDLGNIATRLGRLYAA